MSISKQQAKALAEGFLDDLGSSKDDLQPRETFSEVILLAGELIEAAQDNLNKSNNNASGKLSASLIASDPQLIGNALSVDVFMNFYGQFVNKGVKGTRSGHSSAGFSFKNEIVSFKMQKAIKQWIDRGKISTRSVEKYKPHGKHERKNRGLATLSKADASYAVARSIKQHGIKRTGFMDKAINETKDKIADRLGAALRVDIIDGLRR